MSHVGEIMTEVEFDQYESLFGKLSGFYDEISILSKKSPHDAVNKFKLKFINGVVKLCNEFLGSEYKAVESFDCFDEDDVPQNSDVVFILAQYLQAFEKMRSDNVVCEYGVWYFVLENASDENSDEDGIRKIQTTKPSRLK